MVGCHQTPLAQLTYMSIHTADPGTTIEFGLDGIESE